MKYAAILALCLLGPAPAAADDLADRLNDYPTETRADYVFGCMAVNGQTRDVLRQCACSIDVIASILPYDAYVEAETVLSLQQGSGEQLSAFKTMTVATEAVARLRRAQAEAEMTCFSAPGCVGGELETTHDCAANETCRVYGYRFSLLEQPGYVTRGLCVAPDVVE